jgi:hypothetical protein
MVPGQPGQKVQETIFQLIAGHSRAPICYFKLDRRLRSEVSKFKASQGKTLVRSHLNRKKQGMLTIAIPLTEEMWSRPTW